MLPMPMLKVTGPGGENSATPTGNPTVGQSSPAAAAQQQPDSSSYFQQLLASVQTIDLEEVTSLSTLIVEINSQVALFRDLLIHIGQSKDCPELREKVRKLRRSCVEACKHTTQLILPQVAKSTVNLSVTNEECGGGAQPHSDPPSGVSVTVDGDTVISLTVPTSANASSTTSNATQQLTVAEKVSPAATATTAPANASSAALPMATQPLPPDSNPNLLLLFCLSQLLLRELFKSHRLIQVVPMDMSGYYENRAGPSNLGSVISQILLCKQITPDFNQEELCSITKDSQEITKILADMQEFLPLHDNEMERTIALTGEEQNGPWPAKRRRNSIYKNMGLLCCVSRPNYL